ncbi:alpha/beta hydrolase [Nocardioides sp.]|uniref:alpha/beta fold hydrolase n=1 Tax=Nocardioides sp. TaxID=35761 RepID=UPI002CF6ADD6|nr:alpha/beta hydrolase [Nocardioides sp.]HXH81093.1 alpha/beta hydrolase [Nocardioides sp.]
MTDLRTTTSRDGTRLAYDVHGSGPALVYVTGATCFRRFWPIVQDSKAFAKAFTVYTYDRRGRGDSDDGLPWSVEREVDDIEAVIDAAGGTASVYGHSSGAVLALEASLRLPHKIAKTVLYDAAYVHDAAEKADYERLAQQVRELLAGGDDTAALKTFLRGIGMPGAFTALLPLVPGWRTMKALAPTIAYDLALTRDLPPLAKAQSVTVPTQVIVGQKSPPGLHVVARQLAGAIPHAELVELAGQGHLVSARRLLPVLCES